jgi:tRNA_anti-like
MKIRYKRLLWGSLALLVIAAAIVVYIFTEKFADTADRKPHFTVDAMDFIREFQVNDSVANKKYTEKIVAINGIISEIGSADTTANVQFTDTLTGDYIIFAFQDQHVQDAKKLHAGQSVSVKGSCSGGNYSEILGIRYISFKRAALNKP